MLCSTSSTASWPGGRASWLGEGARVTLGPACSHPWRSSVSARFSLLGIFSLADPGMLRPAPGAAVAQEGFRARHVDAAMITTYHGFGAVHIRRISRCAAELAGRRLLDRAAREQPGHKKDGDDDD